MSINDMAGQDFIYEFVRTMAAVHREDEMEFIREYARQNNESVQVLDANKIDEVIRLGIEEYRRIHGGDSV